MCSLHLTHPSTHLEQWAAITAAPGEQLGVWCVAQGFHLSRGHFLPEPRFELTTSDYKSNAPSTRHRLPPKSHDTLPQSSSLQYGAVILSPLQKSTPKAWCFHPHASRLEWCSWDCTHPSSSSKQGEWSLYQKVLFWSHLTRWPSPMPPLDHPDGLW